MDILPASLSADLTAAEIVELLNEGFCRVDELAEQRGLEKIKTIGDSYMVAAGVRPTRAQRVHTPRAWRSMKTPPHGGVFMLPEG